MRKIVVIFIFTALFILLFPTIAMANSHDGTGAVTIDTTPATTLQNAVEDVLTPSGLGFSYVTALTITPDVIYTLTGADINFIESLSNLTTLDIASTVSFNENGDSTLGDVGYSFFWGHTVIESVSMPSAITFENSAFRDCTSLTSVNLPLATSFGNDAFEFCNSLQTISLPSAITFANWAFLGCPLLESVNLPSATTFGLLAIGYCDSLESISLPSAVSFGDLALYENVNLSSINMPSATTFGNRAFGNCTAIESISLPRATTFGDESFFSCNLLASVSLPSVTTMGDGTFVSCPLPIELTLGNSLPTVDSNTFNTYTFPAGARALVPEAAYNFYDNDPQDTSGANNDNTWFDWSLVAIVAPEPATNPQTGDSSISYLWLLWIIPFGFISYSLVRKRSLKK